MLPAPHRIVPADEAARLTATRAPSLSPDFAADEYGGAEARVLVYDGDLVIDGNFEVESDTILVLGDLTIHGLVADCAEVDHTLLVVTGSLHARNLYIRGALEVGGDLVAQELVFLCSLNDYAVVVGRNLTAAVLWEDGMFTTVGGRIEAQVLSAQNTVEQKTPPYQYPRIDEPDDDDDENKLHPFAHWIVPEMLGDARFTENGRDRLRELLESGGSALREQNRS